MKHRIARCPIIAEVGTLPSDNFTFGWPSQERRPAWASSSPAVQRWLRSVRKDNSTLAGMSYLRAHGAHSHTKHDGTQGTQGSPLDRTHQPQQKRLCARTACPRPPHKYCRSAPQNDSWTALISCSTGSSKYSTRASSLT